VLFLSGCVSGETIVSQATSPQETEAPTIHGKLTYSSRPINGAKVSLEAYRDEACVKLSENTELSEAESVITQISSLLSERHDVDLQNPDFSVQTQQDIIDTQQATTETFRNLLGWVAGVSLLVGGIGIMNIMLVSVTERTREIGLRMALGARPSDVLTQFLIEAVILSLVGGVIGVIAGTGGSYLFGRFSEMRTVIVPASIPLAFGASAVVGIFFGYYPATRAAKLDPIVALRHE